jgi:hypothetical protein
LFKNKPSCLVSTLAPYLNWGCQWLVQSGHQKENEKERASHPSDKVQMKNKKPQLIFQRDGCSFWDLCSNAQIWEHYSQVVEFVEFSDGSYSGILLGKKPKWSPNSLSHPGKSKTLCCTRPKLWSWTVDRKWERGNISINTLWIQVLHHTWEQTKGLQQTTDKATIGLPRRKCTMEVALRGSNLHSQDSRDEGFRNQQI